jgi:predicted metal-dependent phosphoesterase TrpH
MPFLKSRDCYSDPIDVYGTAKARGMDVVTITDHDSINGCLELLSRLPNADDIIIGEEVSCRMPDGDIEVHLGVYGTTEALHRELQPLRHNVFEVIARLRAAGVFFSLNHLFHFYKRQVPLESYLRLLAEVPALEVRNGTMLAAHNLLIERLVAHTRHSSGGPADHGLAATAGSDAHTLRRIGRTWTEAPGQTAAEFLEALRNGLGAPGGAHGGTHVIAGDAYGVIARYCGSLFGMYPSDHTAIRRAACIAFAIVSLPGQFLPWVIPALSKRRERAMVEELTQHLHTLLHAGATRIAPLMASEEQV